MNQKANGRPPLVEGKESMRVGFVITKEQWLILTERARREGRTFSDVVRSALDFYQEWLPGARNVPVYTRRRDLVCLCVPDSGSDYVDCHDEDCPIRCAQELELERRDVEW